MELLDRYLFAVKQYLPKAQQSDIVAELSDEIQSAMEDRQTALGRPLTVDEQSNVLENYGRPELAAARYLKHQYLIGPGLFPFYVGTLKVVLSIVVGLEIVAAAFFAIAAGRIGPYFIAWGTLWSSIFWVIGVVTLIFAIRERAGAAWPARWDPRKLPVPQGVAPVSRFSTGVDMFFNALFLSWVMDLPGVRSTFWHLESGGVPAALAPLSLAPIWHTVLDAFVAIAVARILQGCINLVRPDLTRLRAATLLVTSFVTLVVSAFALTAHAYVFVSGPAPDPMRYAAAAQALNAIVFWCFACAIVVAAVSALFQLRVLLQRAPLVSPAARPLVVL
ncbi:MAG TPA: hypothetical protein VGF86_07570 [Candidatus Tumulicola sp.]